MVQALFRSVGRIRALLLQGNMRLLHTFCGTHLHRRGAATTSMRSSVEPIWRQSSIPTLPGASRGDFDDKEAGSIALGNCTAVSASLVVSSLPIRAERLAIPCRISRGLRDNLGARTGRCGQVCARSDRLDESDRVHHAVRFLERAGCPGTCSLRIIAPFSLPLRSIACYRRLGISKMAMGLSSECPIQNLPMPLQQPRPQPP